MATGGHHQIGRAHPAAGIEHQPGDLLAQGEIAVDVVVIQAGHVLPPADLRKAAQQRLEGRAVDVGHATAELDHVCLRGAAYQLQHLFPLRDIHRPLRRPADGGQGREAAVVSDEIARFGPWRDQAVVFEHAIGLLYGAQAHAVFQAQGAYRWQALARTVQALLDTGAK
ncbi:hypothetical protein D3C80_1574130 [compost metagenome]